MSDGAIVLIDQRHSSIKTEQGQLLLCANDDQTIRYPINNIASVVIQSNTVVETNVWLSLADKNVPVTVVPGRHHSQPAHIGAALSHSANQRIKQHQCFANVEQRLALAKNCVAAKIAAQTQLLKNSFGVDDALHDSQQLQQVESIDQLMGVEGAAAAKYFTHWAKQLPDKWQFNGRNRQPPKDPVNALLSLAYTLLYSQMLKAVTAIGLDPALGMLHSPYPKRCSLVLDLMEPIRPNIDAFVLQLLDDWEPDYFHHQQQYGCRINKPLRQTFYQAWADWSTDVEPSKNEAISLMQKCMQQASAFREALNQHV